MVQNSRSQLLEEELNEQDWPYSFSSIMVKWRKCQRQGRLDNYTSFELRFTTLSSEFSHEQNRLKHDVIGMLSVVGPGTDWKGIVA